MNENQAVNVVFLNLFRSRYCGVENVDFIHMTYPQAVHKSVDYFG